MKSNAAPSTITADQVPPYSYQLPGMSADEAAVVAVREMRISHPCDALAVLWELRREACGAQTTTHEHQGVTGKEKTQPSAQKPPDSETVPAGQLGLEV